MTINAPAAILLALLLAVARRRGRVRSAGGTVQNDVLKEYVARGTYIYTTRSLDPIFPGMHTRPPWWPGPRWPRPGPSGPRAQHAVSIAGGLHHAMAGTASGSASTTTRRSRSPGCSRQGAERIAYVDVDAHHGDGVETAFWDDPRVLTIGLHEHPDTLFPGTGRPADSAGRDAEGSAVNVALPAGTGDAGWLRAFHAVVPPLLREFRPQILVSQHGCDTHLDDPLANLELTIDAQRAAHAAIHDLAHRCGRPLAADRGRRIRDVQSCREAGPICCSRRPAGRSTRRPRPRDCGGSTCRW